MDAEAMERDMQVRVDGMTLVLKMADAQQLETMHGGWWRYSAPRRPCTSAKLHLAVHEFFFFFVTSQCMNSGATRMGAPATPQL